MNKKQQMREARKQQKRDNLSFGREGLVQDSSLWSSVENAPDLTSGFLDTRSTEARGTATPESP